MIVTTGTTITVMLPCALESVLLESFGLVEFGIPVSFEDSVLVYTFISVVTL